MLGVAHMVLTTGFSATPDTPTPMGRCNGGTAARDWGTETGTDAMNRSSGLRFCSRHRRE